MPETEDNRSRDGVGEPAPLRFGQAVELHRLWLALRRSTRILMVGTLAGAVAGIVVALLFVSPVYTGQAVLRWTAPPSSIGIRTEEEVGTLVAAVKLPENIREIRRVLGLETTVTALAGKITAHTTPPSRLVTIEGSADSPESAVVLTNAVVDVFLRFLVMAERQRMQDRVEDLTRDRDEALRGLDTARGALDAFRNANGISDLDEETRAAVLREGSFRESAEVARVDALSARASIDALAELAGSMPETTTLSVAESLPESAMLGEAVANRTALRAVLAKDHPDIAALSAKIEALRTGVKGENGAATGRTVGINPRREAALTAQAEALSTERGASTRERTFRELAAAEQARVHRLSSLGGEDAVALSAVNAAREYLNEVELQLASAKAKSHGNTSGMEILSAPTPPTLPASSFRKPVAILLTVIGFLIAAGLVVFRALRGLKTYTAAEIAFWSRLPVLGTSRWPDMPHRLEELVADLCGSWQERAGRLLVIAAKDDHASGSALADGLRAGATRGDVLPDIQFWDESIDEPALRRSVRQAHWVIVVIASGRHSVGELSAIRDRLGRTAGVGIVVSNLSADFTALADRIGPVSEFWAGSPRPLDATAAT